MITVVSGLPRSGTSLAMQMLAAGGLSLLVDESRRPDENNPRGYYEYARVLRMARGDFGWVGEAERKAVKITWPLLRSVPADWPVRVVWMDRSVDEIIASQARMLARGGQPLQQAGVLRRAFVTMQDQAKAWIAARPNTPAIIVNHAELLSSPVQESARLASWCGTGVDAAAMASVVDPSLWRERPPSA